MEKYIYKITNLINKKCYIGQTNNCDRRFKEHIRGLNNSAIALHHAISKYGVDNFSFEIIDSGENYNELEIFYIDKYNSFNDGYNLTKGGEDPPLHFGESCWWSFHTQEDVDEIISLLKTTQLSYTEIAEISNYNRSSIERIDKGIMWNNPNLEYPIRKKVSIVEDITNDLLNTNISQKDLAKRYGIARTTVTAINNGQNYYREYLSYPLRSGRNKSCID